MQDLEGGTSFLILIARETFRLPGTHIRLPLFEVDEAMVSHLRPRGGQPLQRGVSECSVVYRKSCFVRSTEWQT